MDHVRYLPRNSQIRYRESVPPHARLFFLPFGKAVPVGNRESLRLTFRIIAAVQHHLNAAAGNERFGVDGIFSDGMRLRRLTSARSRLRSAATMSSRRSMTRLSLRLPCTAYGCDRHSICESELDAHFIGRNFIGERESRQRTVWHVHTAGECMRRARAQAYPAHQNACIVVISNFDVPELVAFLCGRNEMLRGDPRST